MQMVPCFIGLVLAVLGVVHGLPHSTEVPLPGGLMNVTHSSEPEVVFCKEVITEYMMLYPQARFCKVLHNDIHDWFIQVQVVAGVLYYFKWSMTQVVQCPREHIKVATFYYECEAKALFVPWEHRIVLDPTPQCVPVEKSKLKSIDQPPTAIQNYTNEHEEASDS